MNRIKQYLVNHDLEFLMEPLYWVWITFCGFLGATLATVIERFVF